MAQKIVVIARTLNEESNIIPFCANYDFADKILITDGGSDDRTVKLARRFPNVEVMDVSHLRKTINEVVVTPASIQTNISIKWAQDLGADWIILDDIDCWPNPALREDARCILNKAANPSAFVYRLYIYGQDQYFPKMNEPGQSLWAWRPADVEIYCKEIDAWRTGYKMMGLPDDRTLVDNPYVCLHYFAPDEATIQRKLKRYEAQGRPQQHPLKGIYAPPQPLPDWALC